MNTMANILKAFDSAADSAPSNKKSKANSGSMKALLESFDAIELDEGRMKDQYTKLEELEPEIMQLKSKYMDKGMEPEEAQDMACEKLGCDPEMFDEYLTMKFDELDEADIDENAFNQAAAAAARAGKDSFEFGGKTHKTTMDKATAHKLDDDVQIDEGRYKDQLINDAQSMDLEDFCDKHEGYGMDRDECIAQWKYINGVKDESVNEAPTIGAPDYNPAAGKYEDNRVETVIFNAEEGGILVSVDGKPMGWAGHPKELAQLLGKIGVDKGTDMFHSSDVDFASEEGFDNDDGAHEFIDAALKMMGLNESSCKRMEEAHSSDVNIKEMDASIIKHLKNNTSFDDEVDIEDKGEYDREGEMADDQLNTVHDAAQELQDIIDADDNLPEWVQSKITKAMDYLDTARDYMKSQLDEKATSQAQQKAAGIALAAKRKGEKPKGKGAAAQMAKMSTKDLEDFASTKHKGLPKKVKETTTSGSVSTGGESSKPKGVYGKGIYESKLEDRFAAKLNEQLNEGVNVSINQPDQGEPSVTISGTGEDAAKLSDLLQLAGMFSSGGYQEVKVDEAELSNSADNTVTMDADYMTNDIAGGLNGPKQQINPNNPGDNAMAMTNLGKDASPNLNLGAIAEQVEEDVKSSLMDLYKRMS